VLLLRPLSVFERCLLGLSNRRADWRLNYARRKPELVIIIVVIVVVVAA
jgi:hypothetical protein